MAIPVMFQISEELLAATDEYAGKHNLARAQVIRIALAQLVGLDDASLQTVRRTKYANAEARKAAQKEKQAASRKAIRELVNAFKRGERLEDIRAMAKTMGIDLEDLK